MGIAMDAEPMALGERASTQARLTLAEEQLPRFLPFAPGYFVAHGVHGAIEGLFCWTDAALFAEQGIPALCFGPGDIARAHSATEWVEVEQIAQAANILETVLLSFPLGTT